MAFGPLTDFLYTFLTIFSLYWRQNISLILPLNVGKQANKVSINRDKKNINVNFIFRDTMNSFLRRFTSVYFLPCLPLENNCFHFRKLLKKDTIFQILLEEFWHCQRPKCIQDCVKHMFSRVLLYFFKVGHELMKSKTTFENSRNIDNDEKRQRCFIKI